MEEKWYLVTVKANESVAPFLALYLATATSFRAYFPEESELAAGKQPFADLPEATLSPWHGMPNCSCVEAPLSPSARALMAEWILPTTGHRPLWQYELLQDGRIILRVEDFSVYMVRVSEADLAGLSNHGIDTSLWEPITLQAQPGVKIESFTADDLRLLRNELEQQE